MKPTLHLLHLSLPIYEQLEIEEALLRADERNWLIFNQGSSQAIVMGISGKPDLLINKEKLLQQPIPVIRRFSGGGTVVVDHNTVFSTWICNTNAYRVDCCPCKIHRWTADLYALAVPDLKLRENDYVIGEKKCGGNAQYLRKGRWLHHTSFLWDYHPEMMDYLLYPPKTPSYRLGRSHKDFICSLKEHIPSVEKFTDSILETAHNHFIVERVKLDSIQHLLQGSHRKTTSQIEII